MSTWAARAIRAGIVDARAGRPMTELAGSVWMAGELYFMAYIRTSAADDRPARR